MTITPVGVRNCNGINMGIHPLYYTRDPDCKTKEHFSAILNTEVPLDMYNITGGIKDPIFFIILQLKRILIGFLIFFCESKRFEKL